MNELLEEYGMSVFLTIIGGAIIGSLMNILNQFTAM